MNTARLSLLRPPRLPGRSARYGRRLAGVCAGLGAHLGINPSLLRVGAVLTTPFLLGPALYLWLWLFVPTGDPWQAARANLSPAQTRLARILLQDFDSSEATSRRPLAAGVGIILLTLAVVAALTGPQLLIDLMWPLPLALTLVGILLLWLALPGLNLYRGHASSQTWLLLVTGTVAVVVGIAWLVGGATDPLSTLRGALGAVAALGVLALALTPLGARLYRQFLHTRRQEARSAERADIAAHLHDSVLQTLALIRSRADDPTQVARLARAQERELRQWLYQDRTTPPGSLAAQLRALAANIEDLYAAAIEVVTVGDTASGVWAQPLLAATTEALTNAARHGAPPISLYLEVSADSVDVYVRDHGQGFDPAQIPADRHGVRDSLLGRMERAGGQAEVRSRQPGTEVHLGLGRPVAANPNAQPAPPDPAAPPNSSAAPPNSSAAQTPATNASDQGAAS